MALDLEPAQDFRAKVQGRFGTILADPPWRFSNRTGKMAPEHRRLSRADGGGWALHEEVTFGRPAPERGLAAGSAWPTEASR